VALVEVVPSASIFFAGMAGSVLPIAIAHGEGRAEFVDDADLGACVDGGLVSLRFVNNHGRSTETYPANPNGSPRGITGLTTAPDRLIQVRRNRLLSLGQAPETAYVDDDRVAKEVQFARRMFADNGWPVIDVTRRSIEEAAAAIINLYNESRASGDGEGG